MNKSEIAAQIVEYVRRNHNSRSDELMELIAEYDVERAIAESQAPQPGAMTLLEEARKQLGYMSVPRSDGSIHRPTAADTGWFVDWEQKVRALELGDVEPSPPPIIHQALMSANEWAAKFPLSESDPKPDFNAAAIVYSQTLEALGAERLLGEPTKEAK